MDGSVGGGYIDRHRRTAGLLSPSGSLAPTADTLGASSSRSLRRRVDFEVVPAPSVDLTVRESTDQDDVYHDSADQDSVDQDSAEHDPKDQDSTSPAAPLADPRDQDTVDSLNDDEADIPSDEADIPDDDEADIPDDDEADIPDDDEVDSPDDDDDADD